MTGAKQNGATAAAKTGKSAKAAKTGRTAKPAAGTSSKAPSKIDVRTFLAENPQYLTDNPDVLAAIVPKARHNGEQVVDMQGFLIGRLKSENEKLKTGQADLLATVRANTASQSRVHGAALALLESRSFRELIEVATTDLAVRLDVDVAVLGVENGERMARHSVSGIQLLSPGDVARIMGDDKDVVLQSDIKGRKSIYGAGAGLVKSEALLRLAASPEAPTGVLALGSRKPDRFDPNQGTELLGFLGHTLELCIRTWLGLPNS